MILKSGDRIKHYKGGIYEVICIAKCTETKKDMVIYKDNEDGETWVRPLDMFDDAIPTKWTYRFEKI